MIGLIVIDEDGLPTFNPELRMIKEYKVIIERDRGSKGDSQGRKKRLATMELAFIYFYSDFRSPYVSNYSESELEPRIKKRLGFDDDWKPDEAVWEAIKIYKQDQETPSMKSLHDIKTALFSANRLTGLVTKRLDDRITQAEELMMNDSAQGTEVLDKALADLSKVIEVSQKIPTHLDAVAAMEKKVKAEFESNTKGRAGKTVSTWQL